ncbi:hypothetical protein PR003_g4726 [Phytophthora rubi]|uniref:Uncharacterized protein n=1 Tax=Phytophthora rubi TaxID=129364 RepID=A0A6A3NB50_9STRA|nr:hypothetical protein PR002_g4863 [Phytophthora rubi]KAE9046491.1 hypothetical protein PR001_g4545 [Phytophthora rubi]KAE9351764.1 hypothetical protein PR003_g4726 [Phytophthora rubi]
MQEAGLFDGPERPLIPAVRLDLDTYGYANAVKDFRFDAHGIRLLVRLCVMPDTVITEEGNRCLAEEALAVILYQLSYSRRLDDMMDMFGRPTPALSRIFLWTDMCNRSSLVCRCYYYLYR